MLHVPKTIFGNEWMVSPQGYGIMYFGVLLHVPDPFKVGRKMQPFPTKAAAEKYAASNHERLEVKAEVFGPDEKLIKTYG